MAYQLNYTGAEVDRRLDLAGNIPTKVSDLTNDSGFITKSVNDLVNYYLKSETYTKAQVESLIAAISQFRYVVVATLPTASADTMNKIYLVPSDNPETQNVKDEYITLESDGVYTWEQIGSTAIDLSDYVTETQLNTALAGYVQKLTSVPEGNIAVVDSTGGIKDGGVGVAELKDVIAWNGIAAHLVDTQSAGTEQNFTFRQSGGDGVANYKTIKGRTLVWNQLVDDDTETVTVPSGHKYFALIGGVASVATSDGTALSVTGGTDNVVDLTQMFNAGNEPATVEEFTALFPNSPYAYNAGTLLPFKGTGIKTTGFNQWDEQWRSGNYEDSSGSYKTGGTQYLVNKNAIPVLSNTVYYKNGTLRIFYYDAAGNYVGHSDNNTGQFTTPANCRYINFRANAYVSPTTYNHDICINISWSGYRNGEYEPYWKQTTNINVIGKTAKDSGGNAIVPFPEGMNAVGSVYDEATKTEGVKRFGIVDLGDLSWVALSTDTENKYRFSGILSVLAKFVSTSSIPNIICTRYTTGSNSSTYRASVYDKIVSIHSDGDLLILDSAYTDAATFKAAMAGVKLVYELATPIPFTWDEPLGTYIPVDELGTEKLLPEGVDTNGVPKTAPFRADTTYSISIANLVRKLNALSNE